MGVEGKNRDKSQRLAGTCQYVMHDMFDGVRSLHSADLLLTCTWTCREPQADSRQSLQVLLQSLPLREALQYKHELKYF